MLTAFLKYLQIFSFCLDFKHILCSFASKTFPKTILEASRYNQHLPINALHMDRFSKCHPSLARIGFPLDSWPHHEFYIFTFEMEHYKFFDQWLASITAFIGHYIMVSGCLQNLSDRNQMTLLETTKWGLTEK